MSFRDEKGRVIGEEANYSYSGKIGDNKSAYKGTVRIIITFIILFLAASLFMLYMFIVSHNEKSENLLTSLFFVLLAIYMLFRLRKYKKREKLFDKNLKRYQEEKESENK